ncbi:MAG: DUF1016 N-terminal domain-containing protein [Gallicola sp.]|nr:DUF1016 N-terminal domain-containing protein [Gallicola sp.]
MNKEVVKNEYEKTYFRIRKLMEDARTSVAKTVNLTLFQTYHEIGRMIVEDEQGHSNRAEYGKGLLLDLSKSLSKDFGRGFSRSNLQNMRNFYLAYPKSQTLSGKLTWVPLLRTIRYRG